MAETGLHTRKKEHLQICSTDTPAFREKTSGFDKYDFLHFAATEVKLESIDLTTGFFERKIQYPYIISCMTGGTDEADNINLSLADAAKKLNIPLGLGSLRYALDTQEHDDILLKIKEAAGDAPLLGNIGAAQVINPQNHKKLVRLCELLKPAAFVVHFNPAQELLQIEGEPAFAGIMYALEALIQELPVPLIVKEVGSGISGKSAKFMLDMGVQGVDVAGAGGTSWTAVEILRSKSSSAEYLWDWGNPTTYCIKEVSNLKKRYDFTLIGSGGINNPMDAAKALALGADVVASARVILHALNADGPEGVVEMINSWFEVVKKIMFLTGAQSLKDFNKRVLIKKEKFY